MARYMKVNGVLEPIGPGPMELAPDAIYGSSLPTTDPLEAGKLWNDAGTVKVSAG